MCWCNCCCATPEAAAHLQAAIAALSGVSTGLALMAVEPMRTNPASASTLATWTAPASPWRTRRQAGQLVRPSAARRLLLGYPRCATAIPVPEKADALLDNGTILVVRKLRQWTGRLAAQVEREARAWGWTARSSTPSSWAASVTASRWPPPATRTTTSTSAPMPTAGSAPIHAHHPPRQPAPVQR